jgi:hypothetical protein
MKLQQLLLGLVYLVTCIKGNNINYDLKLISENFYINYDDNNIILNDYNLESIVKINFEYISDINEHYKQNIKFNSFIKETNEFSKFNFVKTAMNKDKLYYEINYDALYYTNHLEAFMLMKGFTTTNEIIICISFDREIINFDGKHTLEIKNYVINFSNISFSDNKYNKVNVERFGNYFYIHFQSYVDYMQYKFTISYNYNY